MRYGVFFSMLGGLFLGFALGRDSVLAGLLCWAALSFLWVGLAYFVNRPGMLGKSRAGLIASWAYAVLLPYLLVTWGLWRLYRVASGERCCDEVAPRVWVGRLPLRGELPDGVGIVVDLTAEFPRSRALPDDVELLCLPVLDERAPTIEDLQEARARVAAQPRAAYIHCAFGHGRSATVAGAVLMAREPGLSPEELERRMKRARARVHINREQRAALRELARL